MGARSRQLLLAALLMLGAPPVARGQVVRADSSGAAAAFVDSTVTLAQRRDTAALRRLADPRFTFVHSTGRVQDLAAFLAFVAQGRQDSIRVLSPPDVRDAGPAAYAITHTASWAPGRGWTAFRSTDVVVRGAEGLRWLGHQSAALPAAPTFVPIVPEIAATAGGRYVSAAGTVRELTVSGDRLLVRVDGAPPIRYGALTATTFHAEGGDAFLVLVRDAAGHLRWLDVLQGARAERYERRDAP